MAKKLTLQEKKLLNEHVTSETKRCLAIIDNLLSLDTLIEHGDNELVTYYKKMCNAIIKGSPYVEFNPKLLEMVDQ